MDKKKARLNIFISLVFRIFILVVTLLSRRFLVNYLGVEANGLFSLFTNIIGFLMVAELGIGTAISFSMYKPIAENNKDMLSGLYYLFKKVYLIIGAIILIVGLILIPVIPYMVKDGTGSFNLTLNYCLFLMSTVITYLYAYNTSIINAYKDNYITVTIRSMGVILEGLLQIFVVIKFRSFELFFVSIIVSNLLQMIATNYIFKKKYSKGLNSNKVLKKEVLSEVKKKTTAMFYHKIGGVLVSTLGNILISSTVSIIVLGTYNNYMTILLGVNGFLVLIFTSLTSVVGHAIVERDKEEVYNVFKLLYIFNIIIGFLFFLGFLAISDGLIQIIFGAQFIIDKKIVLLISINAFIQYSRNTVLLFKDASGNFYHDRFKPLIEGVVNLSLSIILVLKLGVAGVIIASIISTLTICHTIEPFVLYKHLFEEKVKKYYIINFGLIILFSIISIVFININFNNFNNIILDILYKGAISVILNVIIIIIALIVSRNFRGIILKEIKKIKGRKENIS